MNHNHHITLENSNIIVKYTNERIIPASGLAVVGALLGKSNFTKKLNHMDVTKNRSQHQILSCRAKISCKVDAKTDKCPDSLRHPLRSA